MVRQPTPKFVISAPGIECFPVTRSLIPSYSDTFCDNGI